MNELALFAGAGGGILAGQLLGWRTVCAVEHDAYAAAVLAQRQNDGLLDLFPIWSDVTTFDGKPWRGIVDVVSGGFPCQDISCAGKGGGLSGERSGLWSEMARIVGEVRPRFVFVENSPMLTSRGLGVVLGDLATLGFNAEWGVLGAADVGAPHQRDRIWILGYTSSLGRVQGRENNRWDDRTKPATDGQYSFAMADPNSPRLKQSDKSMAGRSPKQPDCGGIQPGENRGFSNASGQGLQGRIYNRGFDPERRQKQGKGFIGECGHVWQGDGNLFWATEPELGRVANGVANRVDRLKAIGNGQVPQCAAEAFKRLARRINNG